MVATIAVCGFFWSLAYLGIIHRGFRDRTCGMPLMPLGANVAWEFLYAAVAKHGVPGEVVSLVWFALDMVIVYQFLVYSSPEWRGVSRRGRAGRLLVVILASLLLFAAVEIELGEMAGLYSGFALNVLISAQFITMLRSRGSTAGQSMVIAACKMIGTLVGFTFAVVWYPVSPLIWALYAMVLPCDLLYVVELRRMFAAEGRSPWTREPLAGAGAARQAVV